MIITSAKALRLVSSHDILQAVPELLNSVEAHAAAARMVTNTKQCKNCQAQALMEPVESKALAAIAALSPDAIARLRKYIGQGELFINLPVPGKPTVVKLLG